MAEFVLTFVQALAQDAIWINGQRLDDMDPHYRANLIPFLRGNKRRLFALTHPEFTLVEFRDGVLAEEWLVGTPLMRRLVELEHGRSIDDRRAIAERNAAYEAATGYEKIREDAR